MSAMTARDDDAFLVKLTAIVGTAHALRAPADIAAFLSEPRDLYHGRARAVLRPGSTAEVSAILRLCHATRTPVVPQGGNTGLVGGQTPDEAGRAVVLSLTRMKALREIDVSSNTMILEAGVTLGEAQAIAEKHGRLFPLSLASEGSCTIGGNLATNAGGTAVIAYGNMRDLALGLEVVLADGRVLSNLSKLKKDNTGYDLKHLFMGSEGTLGVITAAVLKLFAPPRARAAAFIGLRDPANALALLELARGHAGGAITTFELMPRIGLDFVMRHAPGAREPMAGAHPWYVLLELSLQSGESGVLEAILEAALEKELIDDASVAASLDQRRAFWKLREDLSDVQRLEGGSIKHDVSVPVASAPAFIAEASAAVTAAMPGARIVGFGHLGDGNIHFNVSQPVGADKAAFLARWDEINTIVHGIVTRYDGSISAEHGIGQLKRDLLPGVKDPVAMALMRSIKATLDPRGILNPGKVL